jgi:hypothetical protein
MLGTMQFFRFDGAQKKKKWNLKKASKKFSKRVSVSPKFRLIEVLLYNDKYLNIINIICVVQRRCFVGEPRNSTIYDLRSYRRYTVR